MHLRMITSWELWELTVRIPMIPWAVTPQLNETPMEFQIDMGAEVAVISKHASRLIVCPPLTSPQRTLRGPDTHVLPVKGVHRKV